MQRPTTSSRVSKDQHAIDMSQHYPMQQGKPSSSFSRKKINVAGDLLTSGSGDIKLKRENSSSKSWSQKWIHIIPLIVLLCLFILWYYSYPVDLEIKDGRITAVHQIEMPQYVNQTRVDLTMLAKATPPNVSVSEILIANATYAPTASKWNRLRHQVFGISTENLR